MSSEDVIGKADLHEALFHSLTTPMVAVDQTGSIVEWNHAAEDCTGISRNDAIGTEVWTLQARIAPARIPYEEALDRSRNQFSAFIEMSDSGECSWVQSFDGEILSTRGEIRHFRSEVFPLQLKGRIFFVGLLSNPERKTQTATSA